MLVMVLHRRQMHDPLQVRAAVQLPPVCIPRPSLPHAPAYMEGAARNQHDGGIYRHRVR